ncbi:MAG: ribosomal RNA small subunit methyltransferase A [Solobacterium sp.]|nr:ribosomal RNA small subunit methyltransferase A [Solobacterium sp.]
MDKPIASVSRTRSILNTYDLKAKKTFGQNFLTDVSVVARAAESSHCEGAVIEIGPGIGALTEQLAMRSAHVRCYEVDERLIPVLEAELREYDNVEILLQDFLECDLEAAVSTLLERYGSVSVCANLPYYVTTPILFRLFEGPQEIEWITVMVQKEVGERFSAEPGSPEYSALSAEAQYLYEVKKLFSVPGSAFTPPPKVDSAVIRFHRKKGVHTEPGLFEFIRACFAQRRKTLYNNLKEYLGSGEQAGELLAAEGIAGNPRAQQLDCEVFVHLYERLKQGECV